MQVIESLKRKGVFEVQCMRKHCYKTDKQTNKKQTKQTKGKELRFVGRLGIRENWPREKDSGTILDKYEP